MNNYSKILRIITLSGLVFYFTNCAPSTSSTRYNTPSNENKSENHKDVRFTSDDDLDASKSFSNIPENGDEFDEEPVEANPINLSEAVSRLNESAPGLSTQKERILFEILKYINTPYQYGGNNKSGIDCSAFTQHIFQKSLGFNLPRTASEQFLVGEKIQELNHLKFGDLVYFNTTKKKYPGHVGIYLGEELFAHASQSKGVTISSFASEYYLKRFVGATRIE